MKREIALRMLADIFIPVGERDGFITSMYEMAEDAGNTLDRMNSIEEELLLLKQSLSVIHEVLTDNKQSLSGIHEVLADGMVRTEEHTEETIEAPTEDLTDETLPANDAVLIN